MVVAAARRARAPGLGRTRHGRPALAGVPGRSFDRRVDGLAHTERGIDRIRSGAPLVAGCTPSRMREAIRRLAAMNHPLQPFIALVARPLIDGSYKRTPFFSADTGAPIVTPKVLSPGERERLKSA